MVFFTLIVPTIKAQEIHPELECLCSFPEDKIRHPCVSDLIQSRSHISSYQPEQTWWVSDPSAWGCPPRLRTCMWVTDAGTVGAWRCGWTCVPSWSPQAGSLTTNLYQAGGKKGDFSVVCVSVFSTVHLKWQVQDTYKQNFQNTKKACHHAPHLDVANLGAVVCRPDLCDDRQGLEIARQT